jgi:hypothetical protein
MYRLPGLSASRQPDFAGSEDVAVADASANSCLTCCRVLPACAFATPREAAGMGALKVRMKIMTVPFEMAVVLAAKEARPASRMRRNTDAANRLFRIGASASGVEHGCSPMTE